MKKNTFVLKQNELVKNSAKKVSVKKLFLTTFQADYNHYSKNHAAILLNTCSSLILAIGLLLEPLHRFFIFNAQFNLTIQLSNLVTILAVLMVGPLRGWFVSIARIWFGWIFFGTSSVGGIISPVSESIAVSFFLLIFFLTLFPLLHYRFSVTSRVRIWMILLLIFLFVEMIAAGGTAVFMSFNNLVWILDWYGVSNLPSEVVWATFIPFNFVNYLIGPTIGLLVVFFFARQNVLNVVEKDLY